jgi:hypothetical protein
VSSKEDTFSKGVRAQMPRTDFLFFGWVVFLLWEAVLYGSRTVCTSVRIWHRNRGSFGHVFQGRLFVVLGRTEQSVQQIVGTIFEEQPFLGGSYNNTDLARKTRQNLVGLFWCSKDFPWLEMCICCCSVLS